MEQVSFDIPYAEARNRGTVLVRLILTIPHFIVLYVLGAVSGLAAMVHWFIQVITGKRNQGIFDFCNKVLAYQCRVMNYLGLMFDEYPGFFDDQNKTPVQYSLAFSEGPVNRLTVGLRLIWAIPAAIIMMLLVVVGEILTIVAWFAIVITGKMPRGMFDFLLKAHNYSVQATAYQNLLTDKYPKY